MPAETDGEHHREILHCNSHLKQIRTEDKTMRKFILCLSINAFVELLPRDTPTDAIGTFPILVSWLDVGLTVCVSLETLRSVNCQGQIKR